MMRLQDTVRPEIALEGSIPLVDSICRTAVLAVLRRIRHGRLDLYLTDGTHEIFGEANSNFRGTIRVRRESFFRRIALSSDIGMGEAYVAQDWETDDLTAALAVLGANQDALNERSILTGRAMLLMNRLVHRLRDNSLTNSRANIAYHYDLSNDFYELMLDPTMTYSCALFRKASDTLEQGQRNKLAAIIAKARIEPQHHVLEIGSGWGALAIEMARTVGCRVTTITLSTKQREIALRRIEEAGVAHLVDVQLIDYRKVEGSFDRVVSVEMIEAVGEKFLGTFFATIDRLLKPHGLAVIQAITMPDHRFDQYRRSCDWIQKYIFPGCLVPSVGALAKAIGENTRLVIHGTENIGIHYARTLREWRERVHARRGELATLGFDDRFLRLWDYYLCYCEAGFAQRILGTHQLTLTKVGNTSLPIYES